MKLFARVAIDIELPPSDGLAGRRVPTLDEIKEDIQKATIGIRRKIFAPVGHALQQADIRFTALLGRTDNERQTASEQLRIFSEAASKNRLDTENNPVLKAIIVTAQTVDTLAGIHAAAKFVGNLASVFKRLGSLRQSPKTVPLKMEISKSGLGGSYGAPHFPLLKNGVPHPDRESQLYNINQVFNDALDAKQELGPLTPAELAERLGRMINCVNDNTCYWKSKLRNPTQPAMVSAFPVYAAPNRDMWEFRIDTDIHGRDLFAFKLAEDWSVRTFRWGGQPARDFIVNAVKHGPEGGGGIVGSRSSNPLDGLGHVFSVELDPIHGVLFIDPQLGRALTQAELRGYFAPGKIIEFFHLM